MFSALHCAAMCGPLALAQGQRRGTFSGLRYQLGRGAGYAALGAAAGGSGQALTAVGGPVVGLLFSFSMAAGLVALAARLWRGDRRPPDPTLVALGRRRRPLIARLIAALRPGPLGVGTLTALLPCGALWGALAIAASSAGALQGALAMIGFAGASSAGLIASGWLGGVMGRRSLTSRRALAALLVAGAVIAVTRPITAVHADGEVAAPCHMPAPGGSRP